MKSSFCLLSVDLSPRVETPPSVAGMEPSRERPFVAPCLQELSQARVGLRRHPGAPGGWEDRGLRLVEMGAPGPGVEGGEGPPRPLGTRGAPGHPVHP